MRTLKRLGFSTHRVIGGLEQKGGSVSRDGGSRLLVWVNVVFGRSLFRTLCLFVFDICRIVC